MRGEEAQGIDPDVPRYSDTPARPRRGEGCFVLWLALFVIAVGLSGRAVGTIAAAFGVVELPRWAGMIATSSFLTLFFALLATRARDPWRRAMYRTWLFAAPFPIVLLVASLVPPVEAQLAAIAQTVLALAYTALVLFVLRGVPREPPRFGLAALAALGLSAVLAYPWLVWGVLGSPLDVLLNLATGLACGAAASLVISRIWLHESGYDLASGRRETFVGGLVVGLALLLIARGFGIGMAWLLTGPVVALLGWLVLVVSRVGLRDGERPVANLPALALLIGLAASLPLLFADPDVLSLGFLVRNGEGMLWALRAALATAGLAALLGLVLALVRRRLLGRLTTVAPLAVVALIGGGLLYTRIGQPGPYGDRLFVILKEQTDVSAASSIADYDVRRRFVYETLARRAATSQAGLRGALDQLGIRSTPYYLVNALEVEGGLPLRAWLEARPEVDRVLPSPRLRPLPQLPPPVAGRLPAPRETLWSLAMVGAPRVWQEFGVRGRGSSSARATPASSGTIPSCGRPTAACGPTARRSTSTTGSIPGITPRRPTTSTATAATPSAPRSVRRSASRRRRPGSPAPTSCATWPTRPSTSTVCSSCWRPTRRTATPSATAIRPARPTWSTTPGAARPTSRAATRSPCAPRSERCARPASS